MSIGIRNLNWLDHNSQRRYPLKGRITARDTTGTFQIPDDLIVGLQLSIDFALNVDPTRFFISRILTDAASIQITVGYDSADDGVLTVARAAVDKATHTQYAVYPLYGVGVFGNSKGQVVIGGLSHLDQQPSGDFEFELEHSNLEVDTIRPAIAAIASLQIQNGTETSAKLYGHVILRAGRNFRLRVAQAAGEPSVITLDAIDGSGLTEDCVCAETLENPIRTIQSIPGDNQANMQFLGNNCLEFETITHGLRAKDVCSEPCCGCPELTVLTQALEAFGARATTLENFLVNLEARSSQMDLTVLGSRLGDRGCTPAAECS